MNYPEITVIQDEQTLDTLYKEHNIIVLFVHMQKCDPCERLAPTINQLASENQNNDVFFAKIDREIATNLCQKYSIRMFPTVLIFKNGERKKQFEGCSQSPSQFFAAQIDIVANENNA